MDLNWLYEINLNCNPPVGIREILNYQIPLYLHLILLIFLITITETTKLVLKRKIKTTIQAGKDRQRSYPNFENEYEHRLG